MEVYLEIVINSKGDVQELLLEGDHISIGRDKNRISIDETYISARHAVITREGDRYFITDQKSRNGTFVNFRRVLDDPVAFKVGDTLKLGQLKFKVCEREPADGIAVVPLKDRKKKRPAGHITTP